ncbi:FAD:protein FMN transferase [Ilyomonas limi]|uniref:FAD:protein FMN transferase n=1 Tax=Ilyomonas limi TaxID=2575867 RepID=A0A4U3L8Y8_9BACT|nr:FAD:protein FMN transferase [Ilyomonas limi]
MSNCCFAQLQRFHFSQPKMGSPFNIIFYANDSAHANTLAEQCFQLVDSCNAIFSDYLPSSELNQLSATAGNSTPVAVSPAMLDILLRSKEAYQKSGGTFDITIGPLVKLWRQARKNNTFPEDSAIQKTLLLTGFNKVRIDTTIKAVLLAQRGMQLDLGGIAKGYTAQQVIDLLKENGITQALVDAGGDIATSGAPPFARGWTIGINVPETKEDLLSRNIILHNMAVVTSGDVYQYMEHNGKKYSHITDPRTGYGVISQRNVTVIAPDGATADWLATACSILPVSEAKKLATTMHAQLLIATIEKGKILLYFTKGFLNYLHTAN